MSKQQIREWVYENAKPNDNGSIIFHDEIELADIIHQYTQYQSGWVSVREKPSTNYEYSEWDNNGENCTFDGMVSDTFIITDGQFTGHGHYKDNGVWTVYQGEHDFMNIKPEEITHYMKPLPPTEEA